MEITAVKEVSIDQLLELVKQHDTQDAVDLENLLKRKIPKAYFHLFVTQELLSFISFGKFKYIKDLVKPAYDLSKAYDEVKLKIFESVLDKQVSINKYEKLIFSIGLVDEYLTTKTTKFHEWNFKLFHAGLQQVFEFFDKSQLYFCNFNAFWNLHMLLNRMTFILKDLKRRN
jgi:hypothetical protein